MNERKETMTTKTLTANQISDEMLRNALWNLVKPLRDVATKSIELAHGDVELAHEAYDQYVDELLEEHNEYDEPTVGILRGILDAVFDGAVAHMDC